MRAKHWHGKTALVCGASAGLGRELARQLVQSGIQRMGIVARSESGLTQAAAEFGEICPESTVRVYPADLTDPQQSQVLAQKVVSELGDIDLLINAIGKSDRGTVATLDSAKLEELFRVNVATSLRAIQVFRGSLESRGGTIVLIGSLASLFAPRYLGGYAMAKHALAALAQQARLELASSGIHVMLACPGPIRRADAGLRYANDENSDLPSESLQPGGGAKLSGLNIEELSHDILVAAAVKKRLLIRPRSAGWLYALYAICPSLAEWILKRKTS